MERPYRLLTDSSSDLSVEYREQEGIVSMPLTYLMDGVERNCGDMDIDQFYQEIRAGAFPTTAGVNVQQALDTMTPILENGEDILYVGFSSGMSVTFDSVRIAAEELRQKFPQRIISLVDTYSIAMGEGLMVYLANELKKMNQSIEKASIWLQNQASKLISFIVVDDLEHIYRGGRLSKASTLIGSILGVKPIMTMEDGKVKLIDARRGRKNVMNAVIDKLVKAAGNITSGFCFISHADCEKDAFYLRDQIAEKLKIAKFMIAPGGEVIGSHTGPDAFAVFMIKDFNGLPELL